MPDLNGVDVARQIAEMFPKIPILMVTLHLSSQLAEAAREAGVRGACAKQDIGSVVEAVDVLLHDKTYFPVNSAAPYCLKMVSTDTRTTAVREIQDSLYWTCELRRVSLCFGFRGANPSAGWCVQRKSRLLVRLSHPFRIKCGESSGRSPPKELKQNDNSHTSG